MATVESLRAEKARIEESLRIKRQSLRNIDAKYSMNAAYIAKLKLEIANLETQLIEVNSNITALEKSTAPPQNKPAPTKPAPSTRDDSKIREDKSETQSSTPGSSEISNSTTGERVTPRPNPLGNLSSYSYGLSLYMVNPEVMNKFITGGGTGANITGSTPGVRVVAQSGGLSEKDKALTSIDGTRIEYYIEDLNLTTYLPGGAQKATVSTEIKFKIVEPVGFAFLQDLTRAGFELNNASNVVAPNMNGVQQHFIVGIKFYGYDVNGNVINQPPPNSKGESASPNSLPERYFAVRITKIKFKLDGKIVNYQCDAIILSESIANGQVNGIVKTATTLNGSTVGQVLADPKNKSSLVSILNSVTESAKDSKQVKIPVKYAIEFLDEKGKVDPNSSIANQRLMNDATFDAKLASTFNASTSEKVTIAQQFKATKLDPNSTSVQLTPGQNILAVIDNIITKSEYVTGALDSISKSGAETQTQPNPVSKTFKWYSVNPIVSVKTVDSQTNDWSYEITYQIRPFEVPYVRLVTASVTSTYPGPSKEYNYWLTGQNSEIISYEQQYDNLYYVMSVVSQGQNEKQNVSSGSAPVKLQNATGADSSGSENRRFQYNENAVAQLYSPGDQARARIRIMGDPDYIMTKTGVNGAQSLGNTNFQIDPLNGQVFIEIRFNMASDYQPNGLLNVSGNVQFYGAEVISQLNIKGVVYKVIKVESVFSKGSFTQTLECLLVDQTILTQRRDSKNKSEKTKDSISVGNRAESSAVSAVEAAKNVTKGTLQRAGVAANMQGRQGGNNGGVPYVDDRTQASLQTPASTSPVTKPSGPWKSILENNGQTKPSMNTPLDDLFIATRTPVTAPRPPFRT